MKIDDNNEEVDIDRMKRFIAMSPERKMECLEELNKFLNAITPEKSKKMHQKLKQSE